MPDPKLIDECVHCGFCLPACPTYQTWGQEMDSPRGRIYLMKAHEAGRLPASSTLVQHIDRCLGCLACMTACPSGVKYDELIEQTRAELEQVHARAPEDRLLRNLLFGVLSHRQRARWLALGLWLYEKSGLRRLLRRSGLLRALPERLRNLEALAPQLSWRTLRARLPRLTPATGTRRRRVALLSGCAQSVYLPQINQATLRVLTAEGCEVSVPDALGCCGALSLHAGREAEARDFARRAISVIERLEVDAVVVNTAGCGSAMKHWSRLFRGEPEWQARALEVERRVRDVSELLCELGPAAPRKPLRLRVAYHDACHLSHGQGLRAEPRELLRGIPELELLEIPDRDQCCGSAGVYNLLEPASARQIGARKAQNVASVTPDVVASANAGCMLQLESHLANTKIRSVHLIELLDASIRGERL